MWVIDDHGHVLRKNSSVWKELRRPSNAKQHKTVKPYITRQKTRAFLEDKAKKQETSQSQDKTRQDKTRQDKAGQDKTRQQEKTRQGRAITRQDNHKTRQDKKKQQKTRQAKDNETNKNRGNEKDNGKKY